ncbi:MAG TPA: hypothetical protein VMT25_04215 [Thermoanaerobaculia bacterium]|nr:hypothetical protein [Thermoanaerobaculia bacterium]
MKLSRLALTAILAASLAPAAANAQSAAPRNKVARAAKRSDAATKAAAATAGTTFSVEVPYVRSYAPPGAGQSADLVLNQAHSFTVSLLATDQHHNNVTGAGVALPQTDTFGYFSLPTLTNNPSNPEVFIKILDALAVNGNYWIFYGHLTDLIYDLTVTDNVTHSSKTYHKDAGNQPGGFDTASFPGAASTTAARKSAPGALPDAYVRTSVDISNNTTTDGVNAVMQYCYAVNDAFQGCTNQITVSLGHLDNFHSDDIVAYLAGQGALAPGAQDNSLGTLLVTFTNLPSSDGWEGSVSASTYNRVSEVDPLRGTVGCGQLASLFFDSATTSLVGTAHDTVPSPSLEAGSLGATLGIHNTDALGTLQPVTVDVNLYDAATGSPVGNQITLSDVQPGELRLINDLFSQAAVPTNVTSVIVFADTRNSSPNAPTIEGFVLTQDTDTGDTRFNDLHCSAGCF